MNGLGISAVDEIIASSRIDRSLLTCGILIVDDEPLVCRLLASILKKQNFSNIRFATGGHAALEQIGAFKPDIVLLDVQMPDLSGIEVCDRIRAIPACVDMPILVHSATFDRKETGVLFAAGASDFVSKPINPSELVSRVVLHLERRKLMCELRDYRERTSQELDAARMMQFDLLPAVADQQKIAAAAGLRIGSYSRSSSEIGGDFWGVLPVDECSFAVFLADFAGHGVTAALNTFRLHALIHEYKDLYHDPSRLLAKLNERLARMLSPGQFATLVYVLVEPAADRIRFASAGAPPLIVVRGCDGDTDLIEASGLPLGIVDGAEYQLHQTAFPLESTLLIYSDGLSEFPNPIGRIGDEGLRTALGRLQRGQTPFQIIDHICAAAGVRADGTLPDDTTIVCLDRWDDSAAPACSGSQFGEDSAASRRLLGLFEDV
jgi:sigma-B regulation protein RsbU (phosphoserine phosphatase)